MATESIAKKVIVKGIHDSIPNYVAGGMDATEGTYVWNHTMRSCPPFHPGRFSERTG
jgi:hypothetical protein